MGGLGKDWLNGGGWGIYLDYPWLVNVASCLCPRSRLPPTTNRPFQHACAIARALCMSEVFVHRFSGILSAYGISLADLVRGKCWCSIARLWG